MAIFVRQAQVDDLSFVSQDGYAAEEIIRRKIESEEVFIAEKDGTAVAYLRLEYLWSSEPYISLIRVLEPFRKQGIGRALLFHVEDFLRRKNHSFLYSSSQADEPPPQAWHRHMGFKECGIIAGINEGGIGEVFFRKAL